MSSPFLFFPLQNFEFNDQDTVILVSEERMETLHMESEKGTARGVFALAKSIE